MMTSGLTLTLLQTQMVLHRIKGSHIGLTAGGILKLDSDTISTVSIKFFFDVSHFNSLNI